jgi:hypothetical protein
MSAAPGTAAADQAIAACGGDARKAVKALLIANDFLVAQAEELKGAVSAGYARGRFDLSAIATTVLGEGAQHADHDRTREKPIPAGNRRTRAQGLHHRQHLFGAALQIRSFAAERFEGSSPPRSSCCRKCRAHRFP